MTARKLQFNQQIVMPDGKPTRDMVEIIQRIVNDLDAANAKLAAIAALADPAGGVTVDTEARAAIAAILDAAG